MKNILGLDLGTNSIGWALIRQDQENKQTKIIKLGSRIIPMSEDILGKFDSGITESDTAKRTGFRGIRRLRERQLLRRERLHRVLNILHFLPEHYSKEIDFEKRVGQFIDETEPKIAYHFNEDSKKFEFLFKNSFVEMLEDFKIHQPQLLEGGKKIPYDWTIYYLRKKALTQKIEKEELAWLLLNFNQKRGYYQLRGEDDDEDQNELVEYHSLKVTDVVDSGDRKGKEEIWYNVHLENGWIYKKTSKIPLEWTGKQKEFIVTTYLNEDGTIKKDKDGKEKRSFRSPLEDDWTLKKKKTEFDIDKSKKTVGTYIYDTLLQNPNQKIKGKLVRVVERNFYKTELIQILNTQQKRHQELQDNKIYDACIEELYEFNEAHKKSIRSKDFTHLFLEDIIFFQRPLKSKKSLISDCRYESRPIKDKDGKLIKDENGKQVMKPIKCIPKSHPLFQEFRVWQWMKNLNIYEKETDKNVTDQFLNSEEDWVNLFDCLNDKKEIEQETLIKFLLEPQKLKSKTLSIEALKYRWNFVENKKYPCNETRYQILSRLEKVQNVSKSFLTKETEEALWHILYSVNDKLELPKALKSFSIKQKLGDDFVEQFKKFPPFKNEYGSYSAKAIKKLLPLLRMGKYWNETDIVNNNSIYITNIKNVFNKLKNNIGNERTINSKLYHKLESFDDEILCYKGLELHIACYAAYGRHSEEGEITKWRSVQDLATYLKGFKQHSLRNPIVEQVITETLRIVKDIWNIYGNSAENFFDEIHIELGREMKNPADKRKKITNQILENENVNLRIKALLAELVNDSNVQNVRPYSPSQQEILKIYEEGVLNAEIEIPEDILKISKTAQPSKSDLIRYKLWLEQKYRSPYTGEMIPLNKLFTPAYEIEHIIPQSRFFDDSFSNKVICEAEVNKLKENQLGMEFVKNHHGEKVTLSFGKTVEILSVDAYKALVNQQYSKSYHKMKKLELEEIPEKMIERQMNDTRYISKMVKNLLSNIVRADANDDGATSKNVLSSNGQITSILKQDWGLNDVWNEIITPRFERLNILTNSTNFGKINEKTNKFLPTVPLELAKGFSKKRIDHRHHALDALVIASLSRNHINYLNNVYAMDSKKDERFDLRNKLRRIEEIKIEKIELGQKIKKTIKVAKEFYKPWETFTQDAKAALQTTIASFKQNLRVINKTVNKYERWEKLNGTLEKVFAKQTQGDSWAIRKPMHTPMPYGKKVYEFDILKIAENVGKRHLIIDETIKDRVNERFGQFENKATATQKDLKTNPIKDKEDDPILFTAFKITNEKFRKRQPISELSNRGQGGIKTSEDAIKFINKIVDYKLRGDLLKHLKDNKNEIDKAFSPDGIDNFNNNRKIPIYKLPIAESGDKRFALGKKIGTKHKWMEASKGTNLFFAIYMDANGKRNYASIPFNEVIESQKLSASLNEKPSSVPYKNNIGDILLFHLSPNDLVFVPTDEEREHPNLFKIEKLNTEQINRIYKMVSASGNQCFFIKSNIASSIVNKVEFSALNKMEKSTDGLMIKEFCIKLQVDRLGNISLSNKNNYPTNSSAADNIVSEPETIYGKRVVNTSTSFEDMENDLLKYSASLTPEELFLQNKKISEAVFGIQNDNNPQKPDRTIKFDTKK